MHTVSSYYYCAFCTCTDMPQPPIIENCTVGTTWINLTWDHDTSCCRNSTYILSWQQCQPEEDSDDMISCKIMNPDRHPSITSLKPGTTYTVTLSVECQRYELQNATKSVNTSIGKFVYTLECILHMNEILSCVVNVIMYVYVYMLHIIHEWVSRYMSTIQIVHIDSHLQIKLSRECRPY